MLPDSTTNEPRSHGFVQYAIKAQQPVPDNTLISNTAYIYFDFNPAVVTNTTESLMVYEIPTYTTEPSKPQFQCYPNPITNTLTIQQPTAQTATYTLYNTLGEVVSKGAFDTPTHTIPVSHLPVGMYYLQVNGVSFKVMKQ
jgi:hypothetical protein